MSAPEPPLARPVVSIVVPAYNEQGNLRQLFAELKTTLGSLVDSWELLLVDDGSTDGTWSEIVSLHAQDKRIWGLRLSRNFGHQDALIAGMSYARGEAVITMDADLQHPPRIIPLLVEEWRKGNKIVKTVRREGANQPLLKRWTSRLFYRLFSYLSGVNLQSGMADFRLLDREVLRQVLAFKEEALFLRGIVQWVGYPNSTVDFDCGARFSGTTKYTFMRMIRFAWHGISSFSLVPLRIGILLGLTASSLAFFGVMFAILTKYLDSEAAKGWASSVAIMSFLFGMLFLFLAVLGEYVGRILMEVRERPRFIVSETLDVPSAAAEPASQIARTVAAVDR
ncbi:MAG TPA: glycosyltransferase family 2 protein [Casimicrobiaceae bacterium]|nr:glycosyltransferase family 2 protein [Casimicrobiaceae bacterium]